MAIKIQQYLQQQLAKSSSAALRAAAFCGALIAVALPLQALASEVIYIDGEPAILDGTVSFDGDEYSNFNHTGYQFKVPNQLQREVGFWVDVFGKYGRNISMIHDKRYPYKIFTTLDFDKLTPGWRRNTVQSKRRRQLIREEIKRLENIFNVLHLEENPDAEIEDMLYVEKTTVDEATGETIIVLVPEGGDVSDAEKAEILAMYSDIKGKDRFANAAKFLRSQRGIKEKMKSALKAAGAWLPYMETIFEDAGMPIALTRIPMFESGFNADARSHAAAIGMWQFIKSSGKKYMRINRIVDDRRDPLLSTFAAVGHLKDDYELLKAWPLAVNAYNHGRGGMNNAVRKTGGRDIVKIIKTYKGRAYGFASRNYYPEFLAALIVEANADHYYGQFERDEPILFDEVLTRHYINWSTLQEMSGADVKTFRELNRAFKPAVVQGRLLVPPGYRIRVPLGNEGLFQLNYENLDDSQVYANQKNYYQVHVIKRGDTLSKIANKYGTTVASLKSTNAIRNANALKIGQRIKVPNGMDESEPLNSTVSETLASVHKPAPAIPMLFNLESRQLQYAIISNRPAQYVVERGNTLSQIAERFGLSTTALMQANGITNANMLSVGQKLVIPAGGNSNSSVLSASN